MCHFLKQQVNVPDQGISWVTEELSAPPSGKIMILLYLGYKKVQF